MVDGNKKGRISMSKHLQHCPLATVKILICEGMKRTNTDEHLQCLLHAIKLYCDFDGKDKLKCAFRRIFSTMFDDEIINLPISYNQEFILPI